jgi:hypothetical protein
MAVHEGIYPVVLIYGTLLYIHNGSTQLVPCSLGKLEMTRQIFLHLDLGSVVGIATSLRTIKSAVSCDMTGRCLVGT